MRLLSLTIQNFRQFHGSQKLEFSSSKDQGITVIHGENGSGKTSILNAFKWGFYGVTNFDTRQENILNEQVIAEARDGQDIELKIEIEFEHEDQSYSLLRQQTFKKGDGMQVDSIGSSVLELSKVDKNGKFEKSRLPAIEIKQILPEEMHSYFFFDGERIEKLANASASHQISSAIKTLMGLEIVERAKEHLRGPVVKKLRQLMQGKADSSLDDLNDKQDRLADQLQEAERELLDTIDNIAEYSTEIEDISLRLKSIENAVKLENERKKTEESIEEIKRELDTCKIATAGVISEKGFLAFFDEVANSVSNELEARRKKGELPYKIKPQFIDDLIEMKECICGRPLDHGTEGYQAVIRYKESAGGKGIEEAFNETTGSLKQVPYSRKELFEELQNLSDQKTKLEKEREDLNAHIVEISDSLVNSNFEDIANLEQRRLKCQKGRDAAIGKKAVVENSIKELKDQQETLKEEISKQSNLNAEAARINRKIEIADECARVLTELYEALSQQTRDQLSKRVNDTFRQIIRKPYWAEIDEDYCLQIYKEIPGHGKQLVLEKSTGEKQVTSLSFIGSIISLAAEKEKTESQFFRGGVYPIVMDSPFGALDDEYRGLVAGCIPELAGQVILFATSSQWKGEVEKACRAYVGKEISLIYHTPDLEEGEESHYKKRSTDHEFTTIEDGYHG